MPHHCIKIDFHFVFIMCITNYQMYIIFILMRKVMDGYETQVVALKLEGADNFFIKFKKS